MQVTGTIRSVYATQEGGYQSQNGYIYTFDMAIDTPQGPMNGVIGSKSQPYPMAPNQPITVEVTQTDRGPKFKKINAQYAGQQQGAPQQGQQRPPQQANTPDWDEIARGKVRCNLVCAVRSAGQKPDYQELEGDMQYVFHGLTGQGTSRGGGPPPATDGIAPPEDPY